MRKLKPYRLWGSLSASIGFILDYATVSEASHTPLNPVRRELSDISLLANELPDEIIALRPRRYLNFKKGCAPPGLEHFEGGKYIPLSVSQSMP